MVLLVPLLAGLADLVDAVVQGHGQEIVDVGPQRFSVGIFLDENGLTPLVGAAAKVVGEYAGKKWRGDPVGGDAWPSSN